MQGLYERTGKMPADLEGPEFPEDLRYLWDMACEYRMGLGEGLSGIAPASWVSLDAWMRRMEIIAEPKEISALFWLDAVARNPGEK